ncbi:hypothetical protein Sjap_005878 [Stephania japonica]|uniref:Transforming growth factor-beta receptor-associated protein 1 n=1 Tax=Stephania japonica TaxID=461633 RepID=A0AAP0PLI6_9MAGN
MGTNDDGSSSSGPNIAEVSKVQLLLNNDSTGKPVLVPGCGSFTVINPLVYWISLIHMGWDGSIILLCLFIRGCLVTRLPTNRFRGTRNLNLFLCTPCVPTIVYISAIGFFCAIEPSMRVAWANQMQDLLKPVMKNSCIPLDLRQVFGLFQFVSIFFLLLPACLIPTDLELLQPWKKMKLWKGEGAAAALPLLPNKSPLGPPLCVLSSSSSSSSSRSSSASPPPPPSLKSKPIIKTKTVVVYSNHQYPSSSSSSILMKLQVPFANPFFVSALAFIWLVLLDIRDHRREEEHQDEVDDFVNKVLDRFKDPPNTTLCSFDGNSLRVGPDNEYTFFFFIQSQHKVIVLLSDDPSSPPYLKCLPRDHQALLLIDNVGILVNRLGHPVGGSFIFRCVPDAAGDIASYLILVGDGAMDLYHKKTGCCVQSVSFAGKGIDKLVATIEGSIGKLGKFKFLYDTFPDIICFRKVSAEEQIKDLLRKKNFKEAITLVEELENEGERTRDMLSFVHAQVGFLLLFDMHFEEAINHFLLSETMQPSEIFPFIMRDPNRWSMLVPRNRYWGLHPPPVPLEDVIDEGMMTIQRAVFLRKAGVETSVDEEFIKNPPTRAYLLESAIKNVIRYLQVSRNKDLAPSVKEGVDTFLMYLYRVLNYVDEMEQLASSENSCVVEELETLLDGSGHLRTLAFLYASKGMSSKALAIWRILPRNYSVGLWKDPAINDDDSLKNFISSQKVAATEASKLLEDSSDQDLVLQHLGWIADVDQALAIQILTSEKRTNQLSPEEVIGAIGSKKVDILQRYLQWLIEDQDSDDSQFHTLYALSLAKSALESVDNNVNLEKPDASARSRKKDISDSEEECATFRSTVRERLQLFLQSSDLYDPEEVLDLVEGSELWLEKAILYRKLGQEMLVLQILALKLEDSEAAEQYCAEIGRPDAYMQLLDMYLDPQNGKEPMFNAAVRLLHNHGESLDPRQVLETLSPDMPLQLAADTILRMLRARVHHRCQCQIAHNLSRAINIDARLARLEERSRHVQINDESVCDSCHARLGTKLFAMYPDDAIVCYKCFRRLGESTSVSGRNFKRDIIFKPGWLVNH